MNTPRTDWRCKESVPNNFSVTFRRCSFKAWKDGYCKIHHPESVKARQEKQRIKYEADRAKSPYMLLQKATERNQQLERELAAEQEKVAELREALEQAVKYVARREAHKGKCLDAEQLKKAEADFLEQVGSISSGRWLGDQAVFEIGKARAVLEKTK